MDLGTKGLQFDLSQGSRVMLFELGIVQTKQDTWHQAFEHSIKSGSRHSSVVLIAPVILQPRVQIPSTPSMLFSIYIDKIEIVFVVGMRKGLKETKKCRDWPVLKKLTHQFGGQHFEVLLKSGSRRLGSFFRVNNRAT